MGFHQALRCRLSRILGLECPQFQFLQCDELYASARLQKLPWDRSHTILAWPTFRAHYITLSSFSCQCLWSSHARVASVVEALRLWREPWPSRSAQLSLWSNFALFCWHSLLKPFGVHIPLFFLGNPFSQALNVWPARSSRGRFCRCQAYF